MFRNLLFIFFVFAFGVASSQSSSLNQMDKNGKKQGHWIKKDMYERLIYEGVFKEDKPFGEFKYYYDNGDLKTISIFSNNGMVCKTKHFFPGNILMAEGKYINEKRDSIWKFYNAPNILVSEESFRNGKKDGVEKNFDENGKVIEERNWKDSLLQGSWKKYYKDGSLQQEGTYNMGLLEGKVKYYYPGKIVAVIGPYTHSLKNGKWVYYNKSGKIITQIENYNLGDLDGYYAEWYERDGTPKLKGSYKQGKKNGIWTYFDEKGKLEKDSSFFVGYLHGICSEYYQNGNKKSESNYYFSNSTGKRTEWDESGVVVKEENFDPVEAIKKKMALKEKEKKKK